MKILFLTDNFIPETNAPAHRTYEHAVEWVKQGVEVTVVTCFPNFPYGKVYEGYKNKLYQIEHIEGIRVVRVWSFIAENKGFIKRVLDFCSFMISSFVAALFIKTDLIIATSPQFFTAVSGRWLSFWKRKKWIMEVRDLWPESLKVVGAMKDGFAMRFFERIERNLYRNAWKIVAVTEYMKEEIASRGVNMEKIAVIRNGVDVDEFKPLPKDEALRIQLKLQDRFIIGYIGTHGMAHALEFILGCIAEINNDKIHFLFVGSGAEKEKLLKKKEELNLKNVTFLDPIPKSEVKKYISILDFGLVNLKDSPLFRGALPSKMNELAAMGKPILLGVGGEAEVFLKENDLGLAFYPENKESFLKAIENICEYRSEDQNSLKRVRELVDRRFLARQMLNFILENLK